MSKDLILKEQYSDKDLDLIKRTIAKNATNEELDLFLIRCKTLGLNPLKPGQIFFMKYGNSAGTIVVGRDGFRALAARTGKHRGTTTGVIRNDKGEVTHGYAEVYRADWTHPARVESSMAEYCKNTPIWKDLPETMIQKVAECAALRMAFPDELGGVYGEDERVVSEPHVTVTRHVEVQVENLIDRPAFEAILQPNVAHVENPSDAYVFKTGGARKGKPLTAFTKERLMEFIAQCDKMEADGKTISDEVILDYNATMEYLSGINA